MYLRSVFNSVMAEDLSLSLSNEDTFQVKNIKQDKIASFEIYIILRYLSHSEIKNLMTDYNIKKLPCDENSLQYIEKIADSMISAKKYLKKKIFFQDIFWAYLELLSHVKVSEELALKILKHLRNSFQVTELTHYRECINHFLSNLCEDELYHSEKIAASVTQLIDCILDFVIADSEIQYTFIGILNYLFYLCKISKYIYDDTDRIQKVIEKCDIFFCVKIYRDIGPGGQNLIKEIFHSWNPNSNVSDYILYCDAVFSKIIEPNLNSEKNIYEWIESIATMEKKDETLGVKLFSKEPIYSDLVRNLINLFLNNLILEPVTLRKIVNEIGDNMSIWLLNIEKFDYTKFNCKWLTLCQTGLLKHIAMNRIAKEKILASYKSQYKSGTVPNKVTELILNFFIVNVDEIDSNL